MQHFPIFIDLDDRRVIVSGGGNAAVAKLRLLLKTNASLQVYATTPAPEIDAWAANGCLTVHSRTVTINDIIGATLVYAADETPDTDAQTAAMARDAGVLVNIVDNLGDSQFITPAIVDRDPVTVAIGTEGAAPVLARAIKADIEQRLPSALGTLARIGKGFRKMAETLPLGRARRDFWRAFYFDVGPRAVTIGADAVAQSLDDLLGAHLSRDKRPGHVAFVGAGPGDPELLTIKARRVLDEADVVLYDRLVSPAILELARREAVLIDVGKTPFGPATPQSTINKLLVEHAAKGAQVVRLKSGDATVFGRLDEEIDTLETHQLGYHVIPGITAASASVAAIGQSLTRRGRNFSVRFVTGHDMAGFADHDWADLARHGEVAAIYMGKASARFIQGRLLMHGANRSMPMTLVENASRPDQRIIASSLDKLCADLHDARMDGPVLMLMGLEPRLSAFSGPVPNLSDLLQDIETDVASPHY
jgi:uroporphyrin-III C-methyltransferase/precorrin-2 dehydrogenase/sirohydrochlorin ferrochelatase